MLLTSSVMKATIKSCHHHPPLLGNSGATGNNVWRNSFSTHLRKAVTGILRRALSWDKVAQRLGHSTASSHDTPIVMHQYGVSAEDAVKTVLNRAAMTIPANESLSRSNPGAGLRSPSKSKIAIIGDSAAFQALKPWPLFGTCSNKVWTFTK